jgi:excisionase family DNA binding protein
MIRAMSNLALSTTSQVAAALSVDPSTVRQWVIEGRVTAEAKTPGGHYRFDIARVRQQLAPQTTPAPEATPPAVSVAGAPSVEGGGLSASASATGVDVEDTSAA